MANNPSLQVIESTATVVDTCVILDILTRSAVWYDWSASALAKAWDAGRLVINPLIYAEASAGFNRIEHVDAALPPDVFTREPLPYHAGFLAARAFAEYKRRGGTKRSPMPDFYIGAHAAVNRYQLLTRDQGRFETYFPGVRLVTPENG
ncbi:type II toxin-antitoxin system VapC family toxin [Kribbella deserti]|uniref:Type II toxin-antitoxin system VapC family toxin n=1 Tax=Kribbella deserti TaxID=1926257 RepID=A0ABV6QSR8_9ACTN